MKGDFGAPKSCGGQRASVERASVIDELRKVRHEIDDLIAAVSVARAHRLRQITLARRD